MKAVVVTELSSNTMPSEQKEEIILVNEILKFLKFQNNSNSKDFSESLR